jgi:hypothetical protein
VNDRLAHRLEQRLGPREVFLLAASHDGERALLGRHVATRDRRVEHPDPPLCSLPRQLSGQDRRAGAHVDEQRSLAHELKQSSLPGDHRFDLGRTWQHGDDDVAMLC